MKISVIIPCKNAEQWIDRCLNSIAAQELAATEVIVIDDGSTDNSIAKIQAAELPVTLVQTQGANGVPALYSVLFRVKAS